MNSETDTGNAIMAPSKDLRESLSIYIKRIEDLMREKSILQAKICEEYLKAKDAGVDPIILQEVLKHRTTNAEETKHMEFTLRSYEHPLDVGLFDLAGKRCG